MWSRLFCECHALPRVDLKVWFLCRGSHLRSDLSTSACIFCWGSFSHTCSMFRKREPLLQKVEESDNKALLNAVISQCDLTAAIMKVKSQIAHLETEQMLINWAFTWCQRVVSNVVLMYKCTSFVFDNYDLHKAESQVLTSKLRSSQLHLHKTVAMTLLFMSLDTTADLMC